MKLLASLQGDGFSPWMLMAITTIRRVKLPEQHHHTRKHDVST
jgi:hypothetical protein